MELPVVASWYKVLIMYIDKEYKIRRRTEYYQCMRAWPETKLTVYTNPWTKPSRRSQHFKTSQEMTVAQILFRKRILSPKRGYRWKNVLVYSCDFPVYNNPNPTLKNPVSLVTLTLTDPPSWYNPSSSSGL